MGIRLLDVHVCNDRDLMTEYYDKPIRIGGSTSDGVSPGRGKVRLRLSQKDKTEAVILDKKSGILVRKTDVGAQKIDGSYLDTVRVQIQVHLEGGRVLCYDYEGRDWSFFVVVPRGEIGCFFVLFFLSWGYRMRRMR